MRPRAFLVVATALGIGYLHADEKSEKRKEELNKYLAEIEASQGNKEPAVSRKEAIKDLIAVIGKADRMELYRLDPGEVGKARPEAKDGFCGYKVVAKAAVEKAEQRAKVAESLGKAMHWYEGVQALCFRPHHGLRVTSGKKSLDLLICFECGRVKVYPDTESFDAAVAAGARFGWDVPILEVVWEPAEELLREAEKKAKGPM
jgi:hypothetical protein